MRSPRLALTAWWIGLSTWSSTKTAPANASGPAQRMALLHGADEHAHGNRKRRRQHPAQQQDGPPGRSETRVRLGQDGEELPFLAGSHAFEHDRILSQSRGVYNLASFAARRARIVRNPNRPNPGPKPRFADSRVQSDWTKRNPYLCAAATSSGGLGALVWFEGHPEWTWTWGQDLRPTQGDEKHPLSTNRSSWNRRPSLCHPEWEVGRRPPAAHLSR